MSFRRRLLLFFLIIVVVPMIAVSLVLFAITTDSESGKADARIASGLRTAFALYEEARERAGGKLDTVATDPALGAALAAGRTRTAAERLGALRRSDPAIASIVLYDTAGHELARAGARDAVASAAAVSTVRGEGRVGIIAVSVTEATDLARSVRRLTGLEARLIRGGTVVGSTLRERPGRRAAASELQPDRESHVNPGGTAFRGRVAALREPAGPAVALGVYQPAAGLVGSIERSRFLIAIFLVIFFLAALIGSQFVVRALQGRMEELLRAARRLGGGDFSRSVPVEGNDEFASLGNEFNRMSGQLSGKIEEVERQRDELEGTFRLVGDAFAAGLDPKGSVDLVVRSAVEACAAVAGRALPDDPHWMAASYVGKADTELDEALAAAERRARELGPSGGDPAANGEVADRPRPVEAREHDVEALAVSVHARMGGESDRRRVGVLSIARRGPPFTDPEREVFGYLAAGAAVSVENAALHEVVQVQAVTDELTGLYNARHFHQSLSNEIDRSHRFRNDVGLLLLDIDDFKQINDTFGHQQGDRVLVEVAKLLEALSRDIDEVARHGGEEMAIVLPQADSAGAERLAERIREALEALVVPRLDGGGQIRVTASFGVASLHDSETDKDGLVAAADAALYRAKRAGKNRVARAEQVPAPR